MKLHEKKVLYGFINHLVSLDGFKQDDFRLIEKIYEMKLDPLLHREEYFPTSFA